MKRIIFGLALVPCLAAYGHAAPATCNRPAADRVAAEVNNNLRVLIDFASVACAVTVERSGQCSLICVSQYAITSGQCTSALVYLAAASGKAMREAGLASFATVSYIDRGLALQNQARIMPASTASQLQAQVHDGNLSATGLIGAVEREFKTVIADPSRK